MGGINLFLNALQNSYHLISLPTPSTFHGATQSFGTTISRYPPAAANEFYIERQKLSQKQQEVVRDIWRWKDEVLGDGRDFFVPRPRAISDLISLMLEKAFFVSPTLDNDMTENYHQTKRYKIHECAILSNCARFDVYLSCCPVPENQTRIDDEDVFSSPVEVVASVLAYQLQRRRKANKASPGYIISSQISAMLDLPGMVVLDNKRHDSKANLSVEDLDLIYNIESSLVECSNVTEIIRHACMVTSGMAPRPNRPHRPVEFRPFSSRDAHIMLQMKRTLDLAKGSIIQTILKASLSAGKAARDARRVPEINELRDDGGSVSKHIQQLAFNAAVQKAIEPNVLKCVEEIRRMGSDTKVKIKSLREGAKAIVEANGGNWNGLEGALIHKKAVHEKNNCVNVMKLLQAYFAKPRERDNQIFFQPIKVKHSFVSENMSSFDQANGDKVGAAFSQQYI